jgi:hypothetical protein
MLLISDAEEQNLKICVVSHSITFEDPVLMVANISAKDRKVWTGLIWLRAATSGGIL